MATTYYYIEECPAKGCTKTSWKKADIWGETVREVKDKLLHHLTHSSHHNMTGKEAAPLVKDARIVEDKYEPIVRAHDEQGGLPIGASAPSRKRPRQPDHPPTMEHALGQLEEMGPTEPSGSNTLGDDDWVKIKLSHMQAILDTPMEMSMVYKYALFQFVCGVHMFDALCSHTVSLLKLYTCCAYLSRSGRYRF